MQQVPGGPPQPMGALGPLGGPFGALGASMGLPHGPQGLLKAPPEHHRPDIKPTGLEGPASAEERLVRLFYFNNLANIKINILFFVFSAQFGFSSRSREISNTVTS